MKTNSWVMAMGMAILGLGAATPGLRAAVPTPETELRAKAQKTFQDGNYKDAFGLFEKLCLDPATDQRQIGGDLNLAVNCLRSLNRINETGAEAE